MAAKQALKLVQAPGLEVVIEGDSPALLTRLQAIFYGPMPPLEGNGVTGRSFRLRLDGPQRLDGSAAFTVSLNGRELFTTQEKGDLVYRLEGVIRLLLLHSLRDWHVLHAGVVALNDQAVLFPGACGMGKSTLVAALALAGFEYLSDEAAVVRDDGFVYPFPKAVSLEEGGWRCVLQYAPSAAGRHLVLWPAGGRPGYLGVPKLPAQGETGYRIGFVVLLRQDFGPQVMAPVPKSVALAELVEQHMTLAFFPRRGVDLVARLVRAAQCYALQTSQLSMAVRAVERLLKEGPPTS